MTAMAPAGGTRDSNASTARIGLKALVTMTLTKVSVDTEAIVSDGPLEIPALTKSRSNG